MTTDEMLIEIAEYKYDASGFPHVFMDYSQHYKRWSITWRNPIDFNNSDKTKGQTPNEACKNALKFIKDNPEIFNHK